MKEQMIFEICLCLLILEMGKLLDVYDGMLTDYGKHRRPKRVGTRIVGSSTVSGKR